MPDEDRRQGWDPVPLLALAAVLVLLIAGWWLFPRIQEWIAGQDCIASGHTNCYAQGVIPGPASGK